jgi:hypothetical protein
MRGSRKLTVHSSPIRRLQPEQHQRRAAARGTHALQRTAAGDWGDRLGRRALRRGTFSVLLSARKVNNCLTASPRSSRNARVLAACRLLKVFHRFVEIMESNGRLLVLGFLLARLSCTI